MKFHWSGRLNVCANTGEAIAARVTAKIALRMISPSHTARLRQ